MMRPRQRPFSAGRSRQFLPKFANDAGDWSEKPRIAPWHRPCLGDLMSADIIAAAPNPTAQPLPEAVEPRTHAWKAGKDGSFGFGDLLDIVNPLQHIPVVSAIYRRLTGDVPGNVAELAGDTLFGGPIGLGAGLLSLAFKEETGKEPGEMALGLLTGSSPAVTDPAAASAVAASSPAPAAEAAATAAHASDSPPAPAAVAAADDSVPSAAPVVPVTAASVSAAPVMPAHPPIPLHRSPVAPMALSTGPANTSAAESAFLARDMMMRRGLIGSRAAPASTPTRTATAPIPLQLTGEAAQVMPLRPAPRAITATPIPAAGVAAPPAMPADIARRMQDALDKYQRLAAQHAGSVDLHQ
jgi:hypothetical protein